MLQGRVGACNWICAKGRQLHAWLRAHTRRLIFYVGHRIARCYVPPSTCSPRDEPALPAPQPYKQGTRGVCDVRRWLRDLYNDNLAQNHRHVWQPTQTALARWRVVGRGWQLGVFDKRMFRTTSPSMKSAPRLGDLEQHQHTHPNTHTHATTFAQKKIAIRGLN